MTMTNKRKTIYLAALLHDIGKFYQRANSRLLREYTDEHLERMKSLICPENESGGFGYQHAWWTYKFLYDQKGIFDQIQDQGKYPFKSEVNENTDQDNLVNLAIYHHKPNGESDLQKLIQLADWWSSGMERSSSNMEKEEGENYGRLKYKKVRLKNLLSLINDHKDNKTFPIAPVSLTNEILKSESIDLKSLNNEEASSYYNRLWEEFITQIKDLPKDSTKGFLESFLQLLYKYTSNIPASTNDLAHISLYEHLKTTAAIASCLYDYQQDTGCLFNDIKNNEETLPLLLSCWDISGIQKFIYNVSGEKAAVSLKGRSFYLQLLMETIKQKVMDNPAIQGFGGQIIYSSGGKMFILLPNTEKCKKAIDDIHSEFERIIWNEHKDQLYINQGHVEFRGKHQKNGEIIYRDALGNLKTENQTLADLWEAVIDKAAQNKYRKYQTLFGGELSLEPWGKWGGDYAVCAVTGEEGKIGDNLTRLEKSDTVVTKGVKQQIELGEALKDVDYLITYLKQDVEGNEYLKNRITDKNKKNKYLTIQGTDIHHYLFDQKELTKEDSKFRNITSVDVSKVKRINDTDFHRITSLKGNKCAYGFQFYGGNKQALYNDRNKTFEELCWTDEENGKESTYLGVLRMDVDNLGKIFKEGLPKELRSFSAYSTLSAQLDWFFSGYLNTLRNSNEFKNTVNVIYSGGDDVFAVGRWDKIIAFAEKIRSEFRRYVGGREDISISGGIVIVGEKFPIRMAANMAGEAEDASKDFKSEVNSKTKNAITFFDETISWEDEFGEVKRIKEALVYYCGRDEKSISKALLHQLIRWKIQSDSYAKGEKGSSLSFKWNTAYYLKRYIDRHKKDEKVFEFLKQVQKSLMSGEAIYNQKKYGNRIYNLLGLAARWAEMEIKEFNNKK